MFWKRLDHLDVPADSDVRDYVRQHVLSALEFATLGAYELLPADAEDPASTGAANDAAAIADARAADAAATDAPAAGAAASDAAGPEGFASQPSADSAPVATHPSGERPEAERAHEHRHAARGSGHTSIRSGFRCHAERKRPCAVAAGSERAATARRLHEVRRARRPGRPPVAEQPCTWAAWLAEHQP